MVFTVVPEPVADRFSKKRKRFNIPILKGRIAETVSKLGTQQKKW